ncbi:MAG TPA: pantoate--beta-alanine ligase [Desulfurobacteriaceae bacterium]|nr:pantoate--beta-alanine ligase [Desulfurobacteriaceae bacterium]
MKVYESLELLRKEIKKLKSQGKTIGFVPTMGFLHEGHLALIDKAKKENDIVIVSIFVNPIQFGQNEDYKIYPRNLERDLYILLQKGVDFVFIPKVEDMYEKNFNTFVNVEGYPAKGLCADVRPGHFKGVATVVTKLFNITLPDRAYFGEKDFQQLQVIKKLVKDLNFDIKVIGVPTVREPDGLAKSSRNVYLSKNERQDAKALIKTLVLAKYLLYKLEDWEKEIFKSITKKELGKFFQVSSFILEKEIKDFKDIKKELKGNLKILENILKGFLLTYKTIKHVDYVTFVREDNLVPTSSLGNYNIRLLIAVRFPSARLIDNLRVFEV